MNVGDYLIHEVEDTNGKLKEKLIDPSQLPAPGEPIVLLRGNTLSHKDSIGNLTEGDHASYVEVQVGRPMLMEKRYDGENWIPENIFTYESRLRPTAPLFVQLTEWIEDNIPPMNGELPDKGVWFEFHLQFWMNHYYEDKTASPPYDVFHRSLTATSILHVAVLKTNFQDQPYIVSEIKPISFTGSWVAYDSSSILYEYVIDSGDLSADAFPISIEDASPQFQLRIDNDLRTLLDWETAPNWEVKVLIRARVKEYSSYDRTNEIIDS